MDREAERKACIALECSHPRCAHGRPHCPICSYKRPEPRRSCAVCSGPIGRKPWHVEMCDECQDAGYQAPKLF